MVSISDRINSKLNLYFIVRLLDSLVLFGFHGPASLLSPEIHVTSRSVRVNHLVVTLVLAFAFGLCFWLGLGLLFLSP